MSGGVSKVKFCCNVSQLCQKLSDELGMCTTEQIPRTGSVDDDLSRFDSEASLSGF
jgi:hypothetical protein